MMRRSRVDLFASGDPGWNELLAHTPHDIFHCSEYHCLTGFGHRGTPYLFSYREEDGGLFAWPYLLNAIRGTGYCDVSSVYGYPGPVGKGDPDFLERAWRALSGHWRTQRVVAAFTRFHPMMGNAGLIEADEGLVPNGSTVSIDLTLPSEVQVSLYRKVLRHDVRKARELGFVTAEDVEWRETGNFVRLYRETMERRNSRAEYLIDEDWVCRFREALGSHARLFVSWWDGMIAAALLAIEYPPFLHMHLTGINANLAAYSPLKILLDDIREWGTGRGLRSFHLGGGLGGREDSLFQFKRRFSPTTHDFYTGRWVLDAKVYRDLEAAHFADLLGKGHLIGQIEYFPSYRYQPAESMPVPVSPAAAGYGRAAAT